MAPRPPVPGRLPAGKPFAPDETPTDEDEMSGAQRRPRLVPRRRPRGRPTWLPEGFRNAVAGAPRGPEGPDERSILPGLSFRCRQA
jgi:hypothetical protein